MAVRSAQQGSSPIAEFLAARCDFTDRTHKEYATPLYNAFKEWCTAQQNDKPPSQRKFGDALTDRQVYVEPDRRGIVMRVGVRLLGKEELLDGGFSTEGAERPAEPAGDFAQGHQGDPGWQDGDMDVDPFGPGA